MAYKTHSAMKKILFSGFLLISALAIVVQIAAISDSKKASASTPAVNAMKTPTPKDLVYYRNIFFDNKAGC